MSLEKKTVAAAAVAAGSAGAYMTLLRPALLRWGATPAEVARALPGDEIIPDAKYVSTRAVTIGATPEQIWPWLVQMGQGRGGLYSYDWLENLFGCEIHSANQVLPDLQQLSVGDKIRLTPSDAAVPLELTVAVVEARRTLVLRTPTTVIAPTNNLPAASWAFVLEPQWAGGTRLVVRWRSDFRATLRSRLMNQYLLEPVHFAMERKMLLGIRTRAERLARSAARLHQAAA
jgi:hypothetical protein